MNNQDKTKEKLIKELQELQKDYNSLKALYDKDIAERNEIEDALRESQEKYSYLYETAPVGIYRTKIDGSKILEINNTICEMLGFIKEEFLRQPSAIRWADPNRRNEILKILKEHGVATNFDADLLKKDGSRISCLLSMRIFKDEGYIEGFCVDITDRRKAEEALLKLKKAIYTSGEAIFLTDREGVFSFVNPAFSLLYGFSPDEIIGKATPRIIKSGVVDKSIYEYFWQTLLNGEEVKGELINKRKDGTLIHIDGSATPILDEENKIIGFLGIQRDITKRKQVEKRLREQSDAMEAAIDGLAILNAEQNYVYMNKSHAAIFGYDNADELIGESWRVLYGTEELQRFGQEINPEIRLKGHYQGRVLGKKKDGTTFPQALSLTALENGGMICTIRDITELKQAEQELFAAKEKAEESDRLKTAFLNNISHEIRTPLNGILGFLSLIQDDDLTDSERNMYFGIINQSADRLMNTINDIIVISQIQAGQMKLTTSEINIKRLTGELLDQFKSDAENKGLEFNINNNLPNNIASISTDSIKLKHILSNLIGNAIKFTKAGSIEFGIRMNVNYLEFSVKDTGIGISDNLQQFIFERFNQSNVSKTRQFEGLGLGLSITKSYVEILGGKIWVESKEGKGSTFYFTIPYNTEPEGNVAINNVIPQEVEEHQIEKLKILIVEADKTAEMLLNMIVKKYCKEDLHARTGVEAVEICRNNPDIDLILMDIQLPEMNGHYATREIRKFNKTVVIIAQTVYARKEDREKALEAGCNDYISKPIIQTLLTQLVKKHCNKLI